MLQGGFGAVRFRIGNRCFVLRAVYLLSFLDLYHYLLEGL